MEWWIRALIEAVQQSNTLVALACFALFMLTLAVWGHVLLTKRNPYSMALWFTLVGALPALGALLYWSFGINRVARKARRRQRHAPEAADTAPSAKVPEELLPLRAVGDSLSRRPLVGGNRVDLLVDGDQAFPAMLQAIEEARHTLGFCSYIFDDDRLAERFADSLRDAARRGVQVRLLVDGIGAFGMGPRLRRSLTATGGRLASFWPRGRFLKHPGLNLRNHRKILVADGRVGFTGGLNVSQRHVTPEGSSRPESSDLHFRVEGPVVEHLSTAFAEDWELATGEHLRGPGWFPSPVRAGDVLARGIPSGPDRTLGRLHSLLLGALRNARHSVDLMSPYFIPDEPILEALRTASRSGVRVRLVLPRQADHRFMSWAAQAYLMQVVEAGVEVFLVESSFVHSKVAVVDGQWATFGSANLDPRSFRLNFEFNVEAWSPDLARRCQQYMDRWRNKARRVTRKSLRADPVGLRLRNGFVKMFSPYL
jgi:cardiolipin synthase A/B